MGKRRNYPKDSKEEESKTTSESMDSKRSRKDRNPRGRNRSKQGYTKTKGTNDVSWRIASVKNRTNAGNISWSYQTGDWFDLKSFPAGDPNAKYGMPGVICRYEMLTPGGYTWDYRTSPSNVAANSILTVMRSKTRVRNTYDAPDVMNVLLAAAEVYAGIAWAKRLYATNLMYSFMNRYLPDALFAVQHIDPAPLKANAYAFVSRLNRIISMMNTIYIPDRMPLFQVVTQRYSNYYQEGPSIKDQLYLATPAVLKVLTTTPTTDYAGAVAPCFITPRDPSSPATPGTYTNVKAGTQDCTTDELLTALEGMVVALIQDSDVPDITGDMQNAFGDGNKFIIPMLDPDVMATPIYDEEFLESFMNSRAHYASYFWFTTYDWSAQMQASTFDERTRGWIVQNPTTNHIGLGDHFYSSATAPNALWSALSDQLISVHKDPDVDKTIMCTRYMDQNRIIYTGSKYEVTIGAVGTIGLCYSFAKYDSAGNLSVNRFLSDIANSVPTALAFQASLEVFHYRPIRFVGDVVNGVPSLTDIVGELDIIATIDNRDLDEINRLDMLTMLGAFDNLE